MARETRVIIRPVDQRDVPLIWDVFDRREEYFDAERDEEEIYCYVDAPDDPAGVARAALQALDDFGLAGLVATPFVIADWDEAALHYVSRGEPQEADEAEELRDIQWRVTVEPTIFFDWHGAHDMLARRKRPPLRESQTILEVPAADETDALALASAFRQLSGLGPTKVEKLGWFGRWRARQRIFGNYG